MNRQTIYLFLIYNCLIFVNVIRKITKETDKFMPSSLFFRETNERIKYTLSLNGVKPLSSKGISDICIGEKKILGSAMHRKENRLVYHAVLNIEEEPYIMEKYLLHPKREPEYRSGRSHSMFVTSLKSEGFKIDNKRLTEDLNLTFSITCQPQFGFIF